jgi:phosphatidylglycerol:prolipoprotein diacylglycerol transferase
VLPKLFSIGDFFLPSYGFLVAAGFLVALWLTTRLARKGNLPVEPITNLVVYCALAGMAGSKLFMFFFDWDYFSHNPAEIISLSTLRAAGVYQGGVVLALLVGWFYVRRRKLDFFSTADLFAPGLALGHAIGRLGCFAAGCCWGLECSRPWAVTFTDPEAARLTGVPLNVALHPTQLYESAVEFLVFAYLYRHYTRPHAAGSTFGLYLILYSLVRFAVEFFRHHDQALPFDLPLSLTQWIAVVMASAGLYLLLRSRRAGFRKS